MSEGDNIIDFKTGVAWDGNGISEVMDTYHLEGSISFFDGTQPEFIVAQIKTTVKDAFPLLNKLAEIAARMKELKAIKEKNEALEAPVALPDTFHAEVESLYKEMENTESAIYDGLDYPENHTKQLYPLMIDSQGNPLSDIVEQQRLRTNHWVKEIEDEYFFLSEKE